ncbi:MAG TPA: hypothetical protein VKB57_00510, partial [Acidimicrobiales bacterium]|nr:hypothetical protein [Acidimicrobiales bacterium]
MTVAAVGLVFAALAAVVYAGVLAGEVPLSGAPLDVAGVWLAVAFFACELFAIRVERNQGESYGFTLAMVPLAVGLVYTAPGQLIAARVGGVLVALAITRFRRPAELVYEVCIHFAQTVFAIAIFRLVLGHVDPIGVRGAFALLAGLFV